MSNEISFSSTLGIEHLDDLEQLLFFNRQQARVRDSIGRSIDLFGIPRIDSEGGALRVRVEAAPEAQTLFALERSADRTRVIGAMVYHRVDPESLVLLHIGVSDDYSSSGRYADQMVALKLIQRLRQAARSIKGVRTVVMMYGERGVTRLPV